MNLSASIKIHEEEKFAEIMKMDNISPKDVMKSLSVELNRHRCFKVGEGSG